MRIESAEEYVFQQVKCAWSRGVDVGYLIVLCVGDVRANVGIGACRAIATATATTTAFLFSIKESVEHVVIRK